MPDYMKKLAKDAKPGNVVENVQTVTGTGADADKRQAGADLGTEAACGVAAKTPTPFTMLGCGLALAQSANIRYGGKPGDPNAKGESFPQAISRRYNEGAPADTPEEKEKNAVDARNEAHEHPFRAGVKALVSGMGDVLGNLGGVGVTKADEAVNGKRDMGPEIAKDKDGKVLPGPTTWGGKPVTPEELEQKKAEAAARNAQPAEPAQSEAPADASTSQPEPAASSSEPSSEPAASETENQKEPLPEVR
jgi:hypothetical protein